MVVYLKNLIFGIVLFFLSLYIIYILELNLDFVGISFFVNTILVITMLVFTMKKSLNSISFVFSFYLIFLCLAPWAQYTHDIIIWSPVPFQSDDYLLTNIILFFVFILIGLIYKYTPNSKSKIDFSDKKKEYKLRSFSFSFALILCLISFFMIFQTNDFKIQSLFVRNIVEDNPIEEQIKNPVLNIFTTLSRFLPLFLLVVFWNEKKIKKIILFVFVLLCAFPTGIPRFYAAYIYIPLIMLFFPILRRNIFMVPTLFLSVFYIFPFLNQFRYFDVEKGVVFSTNMEFLLKGHTDAYQNLMSVIMFEFVSYGYQLLGVILFFIPRTIWADKPVGSGYALAEKYNFIFNNISMPYIGEGYVNFGLFGIVLFSIVLGIFMKKVDTSLLRSQYNLNYTFGVFLCAALFFVQRGDLLSSVSVTLAGVVAYLIARFFVKKN